MLDQHINVSNPGVPVQLAPAQSSGNDVVLTNEGPATAWVGTQYVTAAFGLPLGPGQEFDLGAPNSPVYAIADPGTQQSVNATLGTAYAAGSDRVYAVEDTLFTPGMWMLFSDGLISEVVEVTNAAANEVIFSPQVTQFPHAAGVTIVEVAGSSTQVHVVAGVSS